MMKTFRSFLTLLLVFAFMSFCMLGYARSTASDDTGTLGADQWSVDVNGNLLPNVSTQDIGTSSYYPEKIYLGGEYKESWDEVGVLKFMPEDFVIKSKDGSTATPISTTTAPGFEIDNAMLSLVWADGETLTASVSFKIPDDYITGGAFRALCDDSSANGTLDQIDYQIYVSTPGELADTSAQAYTAVALTVYNASPELVAMPAAADAASWSAGDIVTIDIWRDDVSAGTGDLEVYYVEFYYDKSQ